MCTECDTTSAKCIFNWNTSVTGHKQRMVTTTGKVNPLEHTAVCETAGLAKSVDTAGCETVETLMSFACNSSFLSVDGMTCLIPFES